MLGCILGVVWALCLGLRGFLNVYLGVLAEYDGGTIGALGTQ